MRSRRVAIGTRKSRLAVWQAEHVADLLRRAWLGLEPDLVFISTEGDRKLHLPLPEIGGKGVFTAELEDALVSGRIDIAVHSLKDLPTEPDPRFAITAVPERGDPSDVLVSTDNRSFDQLEPGAVVGTSSLRRAAQIRALRPDLAPLSIRGNVPTRLAKLQDPMSPYKAVVLARAGLERLDLLGHISQQLTLDQMLPAPGQGAIALQCRADDSELSEITGAIEHQPTRITVDAERVFLHALDAGCRLPVAAFAELEDGKLSLRGRVLSLEGDRSIEVAGETTHLTREGGQQLGRRLADDALARGAKELLTSTERELVR
jgi:hydroxymethylbilane synthase